MNTKKCKLDKISTICGVDGVMRIQARWSGGYVHDVVIDGDATPVGVINALEHLITLIEESIDNDPRTARQRDAAAVIRNMTAELDYIKNELNNLIVGFG